jgi:5S rRNA maturation endonuclease (ribonuclease M5)
MYKVFSGIGDYLTIAEENKTPIIIIGENSQGHKLAKMLCEWLNESKIFISEIDSEFYNAGILEIETQMLEQGKKNENH